MIEEKNINCDSVDCLIDSISVDDLLDCQDSMLTYTACSAGLNWLAGVGAGPASQFQPPAIPSSWKTADFTISNSN